MNEKKTKQKLIRISFLQKKILDAKIKFLKTTLNKLFETNVLDFYSNEIAIEIKKNIRPEYIYKETFFEVPNTYKSDIDTYKRGDMIQIIEDIFIVGKILKQENVLKVFSFPYTKDQKSELIFLESEQREYKIFRR